jgi:assimilatory nitrate reductase catalytic subunit
MKSPAQHHQAVRTTCPYCGVGCGLIVEPDGNGGAAIAGDPAHPANFARICSKGAALGETLALEGRLLHPMRRQDGGKLARIGWDDALDRVASGFRQIVERHGPHAVAFYLSGQLLTEDYYVANKLMKGFIGSANVDTNSRLCMASSVAGHRRAFGSDTVPGTYADLDEADLIVLVGSNAAWCHPVLFQRMMLNKELRGARFVVIDPRRTATAQEADLFLPISPGTDTALFCGLLVHMAETHALDYAYIDAHTNGFEDALARARMIAPGLAATARATGLPVADVARFFELFCGTERVVTCYSQGVNQSAQGTDKVNAIINCHLACGRIGRPGMGPFSLTGQPNAMGGREVGGLANQLAAHMGFSAHDVDRVRRFWNAPNVAAREGPKAVQMFEAIARGEIKALWVMATNPAVSLPRAEAVRKALKSLELFVVSENVLSNDTVNAGAHLLLPAAAWGEKDGTVTNSERRISRQRTFLRPPDEVRPDWWIVTQVARRMGFAEAFPYARAADIFREHAGLSAFENGGTRDFDLGALVTISDAHYDALEPVQWPLRAGDDCKEQRFFSVGGFFTPSRKAQFIAPEPPALREETTLDYPLRLNTGRVRDQWHTMTRTGQSPRLAMHLPEPFVELHPADARAAGLGDAGFARVATAHGSCIMKVIISESQQPGSLFVPIHWSDETASCARVGDLVAPHTDPHSGQPEAKATPAVISPVVFSVHGFARTRGLLTFPPGTWWVRTAVAEGFEYRLAARLGPLHWHDFAFDAFSDRAQVVDELVGRTYSASAFAADELYGCLCVGPIGEPLQLAALSPAAAPDHGGRVFAHASSERVHAAKPIICACFAVELAAVRDAIACGQARSVAQIGRKLRAGTNCGSCITELKRLINDHRAAAVIPGRREAANPEPTTTDRGYGSRVRGF